MASCRAGRHRRGGLRCGGSAGRANVVPGVGGLRARRRIRARSAHGGVHRPIRWGVECLRALRPEDGLDAPTLRARRAADGSIRRLAWDRRGRPAPNGRLEGGQDAGGRRRVGAPWRHDPTRHATRTMANVRTSARPTPAASVVRRRAGLVAVSLAGSLAGLAAGTAGGAWGTQAGRGPSSGSSTIASGQAVARPPGPASSGVAMVLAPASAAGVARSGREDGAR
jgi:hypothetical protein